MSDAIAVSPGAIPVDESRHADAVDPETMEVTYSYVNDGNPAVDVPLVLRKDVELLDVDGQIAARVNTVRIAHQDVSFVPQRGDTFVIGAKTYTVGRRVSDDGYAYTNEVTS